MKQEALLIVDIQNEYFPNGNRELEGMEKAALNAQQLLKAFRDMDKPIIHVQHFSYVPGATAFAPGTTGVEIHSTVKPINGEQVIEKRFPNSFRGTSLHEQLEKLDIELLTICGAMSHMCIDTTVRAAFDLGYDCRVASDACATKKLEFDGLIIEAKQVHAAFMAALSVPFAQILETKSLIG